MITENSRFTSIRINFSGVSSLPVNIIYDSPDEDGHISFGNIKYPGSGTDDYDRLAILQTIQASSDGFRDPDGNPITVNVSGFRWGTDLESIEAYGYPNPLIGGSWLRWQEKEEIGGSLQQDGSFARDADTGIPEVTLKGKWNVEERSPDGANFDADLQDWTIEDVSGATTTLFRLRLELQSSEDITPDGLDDYTPVRALLAWLESKRSGGSAVGTDATADETFNNTTANPRTYVFEQEDGDSDITVRFNYLFPRVLDSNDTNVLLYILEFRRLSGADLDTSKIRDLFQTETVSIGNTDEVMESGEVGGYNTIVKAGEIHLGSENVKLKGVEGGFTLTSIDGDGTRFTILVSSDRNRTKPYKDLAVISGQSHRTIPEISRFDTIHLDEDQTADRTIRIPNPGELVGQEGSHRKIAFHNVNEDQTLHLQDWDGNALISLAQNEYAEFQATLEGRGNGGRLIGIDLPDRELLYQESAADLSLAPSMSVTRWTRGSQTERLVPFSETIRRINSDAFISYGNAPGGDQGNYNDEDSFDMRGTIRLLMSGILTMETDLTLKLYNSPSGSIGSYHRLRHVRIPEGDVDAEHEVGADRQLTLSGNNAEEDMRIVETIDVLPDDRILTLFNYYTNGTTLSDWGKVKVLDQRRFMRLKITINKRWSA